MSAFKGKSIHRFAAFVRLTQDGKIPTGSVLIVDSLRSLRLDLTDGLYGTCRAIESLLAHGIEVVLLDPPSELKPTDDFMESVFRIFLYGEAARHDSERRSARARAAWRARNRA